MSAALWRTGSRADGPRGTDTGSQGGAGLPLENSGKGCLGRESIQEEINLVTEQSLRLGQKDKTGNKIIKK